MLVYIFLNSITLAYLSLISHREKEKLHDRDNRKYCERHIDDDRLPYLTVVGYGGDTDRTKEIEAMVDDDIWHDASSEESVAKEDKRGTDPAKYIQCFIVVFHSLFIIP